MYFEVPDNGIFTIAKTRSKQQAHINLVMTDGLYCLSVVFPNVTIFTEELRQLHALSEFYVLLTVDLCITL
jgi:hypothetical protein